MLRHNVLRLALELLSAGRAPAWLPEGNEAAGFVLTLHHVAPARKLPFAPNALLSITPEFLDRALGHLRAGGWRLVSVDEILTPPPGGGYRRRVAITLDDGYRDNLEHAWPVFRRHQAPFTIFVCPGFCDRTAELWWEALERVVAAQETVPAPGGGEGMLATRGSADKMRAFLAWRKWLMETLDEREQRVAIRALCSRYGLDLAALARHLVMDWDEVRKIAADPLCTIGAHTMTHPALARLAPDLALREMQESAERIKAETGRRPTTLAFPYGSASAAGPREAGLAEAAGLAGSFTTRPGYIPERGSRHGLPRVSVNGYFQATRFLDVLLTPGLWDLKRAVRG